MNPFHTNFKRYIPLAAKDLSISLNNRTYSTEAAKAYASGVRILLSAQEEEGIEQEPWLVDDVELARTVGDMEAVAAQAQENAVSAGLLHLLMEVHEGTAESVEALESIVVKLEGDRDQLEADSYLARRQYQAVSQVLEDLEAIDSCTRRDLASSERIVARLEEEIVATRSGVMNTEKRLEDLEEKLVKVRNSSSFRGLPFAFFDS